MVKQFVERKTRLFLPFILAVISAICIIFIRRTENSTLGIMGGNFAYSDIFIIIPAAIGGLGCGMLTFVLVFIGDFIRINGDFNGLFAISTYLFVAGLAAHLSYIGWYKGILRTAASFVLTAITLSLLWYITFNVLIQQASENNMFYSVPCTTLLIMGIPESLIATLFISVYFKFAPDKLKFKLGSGWIYVENRKKYGKRKSVLGRKITMLSLAEAIILDIAAIAFTSIHSSIVDWKVNIQIFLMILCTSVPATYLFNWFIQIWVVHHINAMSFVMDSYFDSEDENRGIPDLNIHSGDEIEKLYHSLQKMTKDMSCYMERILQQERKSTHLTQGFMLALAKAVDAKDHYTSGHSERVATYAKEIARRMGKTPARQDEIYTMGLLHDIGKIGISEAIINKNGKLTDAEFAQIKTHPIKGYEILKNVTELPSLANGARWHHEKYNGTGYPDGLAGNDIPEEARIIAVADAYDAMTSKRAYSGIRAQDIVRAEIVRCKGSQFDPAIADIMLSMIDDDKEYTMHENS